MAGNVATSRGVDFVALSIPEACVGHESEEQLLSASDEVWGPRERFAYVASPASDCQLLYILAVA
jgi:hypothetical protein